MTLLDTRRAPAVEVVRRRWWARVWGLPVWAHLVGLAAILLVLVPVVGPRQSFIADEGAAVLQARSLEAGRGWIVKDPLPEADPGGAWYPLVNAEHGEKGFAPLAKHPAYPVLAAIADRLGGVIGMVLLSLAGTIAAAALAAALAAQFDPRLARPAVWAAGLASPLMFDGFLVMAHTLGAALATAAVLAAVVALRRHRPGVALLVAPAVAGAVLLRNEALLFAGALALVAATVAVRRAYRRPAALVAAAALTGAVAARLVERLWLARITGGALRATAVGVPAAGAGLVRGRVDGFVTTWLTPGYGGGGVGVMALLVMLAAIVWCAIRARTNPEHRAGTFAAAAVAALAAVVAVATAPFNVVPGLLLAFPLGAAGICCLRRGLFADIGFLILGATAGLFALAVVATQYAVGGSGEWGGRYFVLMVPAAVPLFLAALDRQGRWLPASVRRGTVACLVVCSLALSTMAIGALHANHRAAAALVAGIEVAGRATGDDQPVVVTDWVGAPRLAWATFEDHRWLFVPRDEVFRSVDRLRASGVDRFVFVTRDLASVRPQLTGTTVVSTAGASDGEGQQILVVSI